MLIVGNGHVVTRDAKNQYFPDGAVAIDGTKICRVGQTEEVRQAYPEAAFIDAKGGVIMPAFINVHEHIYSAMARGMNIDGYAPKGFLDVLDGLWWNIDRHLTNDLTYLSAMETYVECIKNGVTTVFDHHASFGEIKDSLFAIGQAAQELGVRSCLCYEVSDRDGKDKARQAVLENEAWIRHAQADTTDMIAGMMGMHAQFTISDETMALAAEHKPDGVGYHIHVAEGIEERDHVLRQAFIDDDDVGLRDADIFRKRAVAVHADADGVLAPLDVAAVAVAAAVTCDVALAGNALADVQSGDARAKLGDLADVFMADGHGRLDVLLRPWIPVINMYVRTADGGFVDLNEHLPDANLRYGHLHQRQTRSFFRFDQSIHHLGNHCSNLPS